MSIPFVDLKMRTSRIKRNMPTEPHRIPLSRQALALLRDLHAIAGGGRFLFPNNRRVGRPVNRDTLNNAIRDLGYAKELHCALDRLDPD